MQKIHMVGIGGIGLSALAQFYKHKGSQVGGSDRSESPVVDMLRAAGIKVDIGHRAENVSSDIELLVYSDAVPKDNVERMRAKELRIEQLSYFEALGNVSKLYRTVAIAGTNGKTTVTAMLGKILIDVGLDPTVIVGSVTSEWGSNFRAGQSDLFVVEACEYREHFLNFRPELLVITNIEWDHTDYFKSFNEYKGAFDKMRALSKIVIDSGLYFKEQVPELLVPGEFNKENARAAKVAARALAPGISEEAINLSLATFKGSWRRFEYSGLLSRGAALYDDYAHHPTAIAKTIQTAREKFPDKKIVVFFHPHLYSRTRDLFDDFAKALATADNAYILPIYAARETYDPVITHEALAREVSKQGGRAKSLNGFEEAEVALRKLSRDNVAFLMGAGDIYTVADKILNVV